MNGRLTLTMAVGAAFLSALFVLGISLSSVAAASTNTVIANVVVGNVIYLSLTPNTLNLGNVYPSTATFTNSLATDNDIGGNIAANILIKGTGFVYNANSIGVSNTLWSATTQSTYAGTALTTSFADTSIIVPQPTQSTPSQSNSIYLGFNIPASTPPGLYTQTISFENQNFTYSIYNAISTANTLAVSANVQGACYISLNPTTVNFGSVYASANVPVNNLVTDTDGGGNVAASVLVDGTSWVSGSNNFGVSNTLWNANTQSTYTGNQLTGSLAITGITVPAPTQSSPSASNSIYFGVGVPGGTAGGIYQQTITIENSC